MFDRIVAFFYATVLHCLFVALLLVSMELMSKVNLSDQLTAIQATTIGERDYQAVMQRLQDEKVRRETEEQSRRQAVEDAIFDLEAEKARIARQDVEEQQRREEQHRQAEQEAKRRAEEQRLAKLELLRQKELRKAEEEAKRQAEEERKQLEAEQKRQAAEEAKRLVAEKKRMADEEKRRSAEEKQRMADSKRKQAEMEATQQLLDEEAESIRLAEEAAARQRAEDARRNAEALRAQREADKSRQMAERERLKKEVTDKIISKVQNRWQQLQPPGIPGGLSCGVQATLLPDGAVADVKITRSSGHAAFDSSVVAAFYAASPLPVPKELMSDFRITYVGDFKSDYREK